MSDELSSYSGWNNWLLNVGAVHTPAELHGMTCGLLCGSDGERQKEWPDIALDFLDLDLGQSRDEIVAVLSTFYEQVSVSLNDENFGLQLMLPEDDTELLTRACSLGEWCQGFLHGFGRSGIGGEQEIPADVADALRDLAQICLIETDIDASEENETYWMELVEYVRMAAITIHMEIGSTSAPISPALH